MRETRNEPWFWRSAGELGRLRLENGSHQSPDEGACARLLGLLKAAW